VLSQSDNVQILDHWYKDGLPTTYDGESIFNEVWGFQVNDIQYAVIGSTMGTHLLMIDSNDHFIEIDFVLGRYAGIDAIHRDYHDYNGYLYAVCDENESSLQIMDLQYLPDSMPVVYDNDSLIVRAHNIFIDTSNAKLYGCSVKTHNGNYAMVVYDISNPIAPQLITTYDMVGHVHDVYVVNDTAFLNCGNEGLKVLRFTNSGAPVQLGELSVYPYMGYNHSGWLNASRDSYVMCDETPGMNVKVLDVSDLNDITVSSTFSSGFYEETLPHNVIVRGDVAFISYYNDGIHIYDIKTPDNPKRLGYYDTYDGSNDLLYRGVWGVYPIGRGEKILVSDRKYGLYLMSFITPPITNNDVASIFPNPSPGYIYFFKEHFGEADYQLEIYDPIGRLINVFFGNNDYLFIDLNGCNTGIYFLRYISNLGNDIFTKAFFIE